jgi:hypothetical protein
LIFNRRPAFPLKHQPQLYCQQPNLRGVILATDFEDQLADVARGSRYENEESEDYDFNELTGCHGKTEEDCKGRCLWNGKCVESMRTSEDEKEGKGKGKGKRGCNIKNLDRPCHPDTSFEEEDADFSFDVRL